MKKEAMLQSSSPQRHSLWLFAVLGLSCAASVTAPAAPPKQPSAPSSTEPAHPVLRQPEWLPDEVSEILSQRMQRHGRQMMFLLMDVLTLNHPDTAEEADTIAAEPRFGRPAPGEQGTISALLPARFFDLEEQLHTQAHALAEAARAEDEVRLVTAYGQLTQTCVSCHSVYLHHDAVEDRSGD